MKWFNPFTWSTLALQIVGTVLMAILLVWYVDSKLEDYYNAEIKAEVKAASDKANATITARNLANEKRRNEALNAKNKQLETIVANGKHVTAADDRLQNSLHSSAAARTEISACIQRADSLEAVQLAVRGFTQRIIQECDRHIADKESLKAAWPK